MYIQCLAWCLVHGKCFYKLQLTMSLCELGIFPLFICQFISPPGNKVTCCHVTTQKGVPPASLPGWPTCHLPLPPTPQPSSQTQSAPSFQQIHQLYSISFFVLTSVDFYFFLKSFGPTHSALKNLTIYTGFCTFISIFR